MSKEQPLNITVTRKEGRKGHVVYEAEVRFRSTLELPVESEKQGGKSEYVNRAEIANTLSASLMKNVSKYHGEDYRLKLNLPKSKFRTILNFIGVK